METVRLQGDEVEAKYHKSLTEVATGVVTRSCSMWYVRVAWDEQKNQSGSGDKDVAEPMYCEACEC